MHKFIPGIHTLSAALWLVGVTACDNKPSPTLSPTAEPAQTAAQSAAVAATATATASAPTPVADVTATAAVTAVASASAKAADAKSKPAATTTAVVSAAVPDESNKGEEKKGPSFSAFMSGGKAYKAGQPGTVTAVVNAIGEYKINQEYPFKIALSDSPGISFPEKTIKNVNRGEKRATITIPFTPEKAGQATISGTCSLSVCTKEACVIEKVPLSVSVKVE